MGGIEEGRSAVQIVGQVMQTLYDPKTGRPIRSITAIMRNACTVDADVIFGNRLFASDRLGRANRLWTSGLYYHLTP